MQKYSDAALVCLRFLVRVQEAEPRIAYFVCAHWIVQYIESDERDNAEKLQCGWTDTQRTAVVDAAAAVFSDPRWLDIVQSGLEAEDNKAFHQACRAAYHLGIDTYPYYWNRLLADPTDALRWSVVMASADDARIDDIVAFAESQIPLDEVATGAADELGFGPDYVSHTCLDFVLQDLGAFTGKGWRLVEAGLRSPVVRNRQMALNALEQWEAHNWRDDTRTLLNNARDVEPNEKVRARLDAMLAE